METLRADIEERCLQRGRFSLRSGGESGWYYDLELATRSGDMKARIARAMFELTADLIFDAVGGPPMGAISVAEPLAMVRINMGLPTATFDDRPLHGGQRALIVDDVLTTGESIRKVKGRCERPIGVAVVVDRGESAADWLRKGFIFRALFTAGVDGKLR